MTKKMFTFAFDSTDNGDKKFKKTIAKKNFVQK